MVFVEAMNKQEESGGRATVSVTAPAVAV